MEIVAWCFNAADTNLQIWVCFESHFAVDASTQKNRYSTRNEQQDISYNKRVADNNTRWVGCTNIHVVY
jgi:hypothetical protein